MHNACELCVALGFKVEIQLRPDGPPNLDIYSQKAQELLATLARAERHVRGGQQRRRLAC